MLSTFFWQQKKVEKENCRHRLVLAEFPSWLAKIFGDSRKGLQKIS
jgi:hypothetical protein